MTALLTTGRSARTIAALCAGAVLLSSPHASALNPAFDLQQYGHSSRLAREGFVNGTIRTMAQTPDGYLWLGTDGGLVRFDGVRAAPWTPPPGQRLPSTIVHHLLAARDGTLWVATFQGLVSFKDGQLTHYPALSNQQVSALAQDRHGTVWAGTSSLHAAKLCAVGGGNTTCVGEDGKLGRIVWALQEDRAGVLWVVAGSGVWQWTTNGPTRHLHEPLEQFYQLLTRAASAAGVTLAHGDLIREIPADGRSVERVRGIPPGINVTTVVRDRDNGLWIGTEAHGLLRLAGDELSVLTSANGLSGDHVTALFEDREGTMWVATSDGLDSFRELPIVPTPVRDERGTKVNPVAVLATRDGSVWIGTDTGLHRRQDGHTTIYRTHTHPGLTDDRIQSLFEDQRGRVWVTGRRGLSSFQNGAFTAIPTPPLGYVFAVSGDGSDGVWVSSWDQGVLHVSGGTVVQQFTWQQLGGRGVGSGLASDAAGGVWIATTGGSLSYVRDGRVQRTLTTRDGLGEPLTNVQRDTDGAIWTASEVGFSRIADGRLATMTMANGLPCNEGHWIVSDGRGAYWLFLRCGLVRIPAADVRAWIADPQTRVNTTTFDALDGVRLFAYNRLERPQVAQSTDGRLWMVFPGGLGMLDPAHISTNTIPPPVHIDEITVDGATVDLKRGLRLPPNIRDLRIDYDALSLAAPQKVRFRFKLEGQDPDWREISTERTVHYSNLGPGDYRFRVIASNNSGVWNEQGAALAFAIAPAYYQTNGFRVLTLVLALALAWAAWQLRLRQLAGALELAVSARAAERTRIARDLHDTLLQDFQGLLLLFESALKLLPERPVDARIRLQRALDQAMNATTQARNAVQGLRSPAVGADDLYRSIAKIADEGTGPDAPTVHVFVTGTPRRLKPLVHVEVVRIATEAVRNALHHAQARDVTVEIRYESRQFRVRVRDEGKGLDQQAISEGARKGHFGLQGMRERAEIVGGRLEVWSKIDEGTRVDLSIPAAAAYVSSAPRSMMARLRASATADRTE